MSDSPIGSPHEENFTSQDAEAAKSSNFKKNLTGYRSKTATQIGAGSHSLSYATRVAASKASKSASNRRNNTSISTTTVLSSPTPAKSGGHTPLTRSSSSPASPLSRSFVSSSSSSKKPFGDIGFNNLNEADDAEEDEEDDGDDANEGNEEKVKDDEDDDDEDYEMPDWLRISHSKNNESLLRAAQRGLNSALLSSTDDVSSSSAVDLDTNDEGEINHIAKPNHTYSSALHNEESEAMMDSALLASPELSSKIFRLKAWEESLRKKENDLKQRETAVSLVDSRLKLVHRLKQDVEAREVAVKEREIKVSDRECAVDEIVRNASADERTQLSSLLTEVGVLRERLMRDLDKREARVRELEAQYEPKFRSVEAKEAAVRSLMTTMKETLDEKEAELAAMAVAVRDVASQFRLPHIAAQANAALSSVLRSQAVLQPQLSPNTSSLSQEKERGERTGEGEMLTWLDERFKRQHSEIQNAKSLSPESFVLPQNIRNQAQAQSQIIANSQTPKRAAPRIK
jgi:hypothetical protein